jgi:DNA-directed RNA polymerase subunit alpha
VRKVNFSVERTRVGQVTDYERLVLEIWTDGTISPLEAVQEAADGLVTHFFLFSKINQAPDTSFERPQIQVSPEIYQTPIERLDLSPRTLNCLKRAHITKVGEVLEMSDDELLKIRNFGDKSLEELRQKLAERGIVSYPKGLPEPGDGEAFPTDELSTIGLMLEEEDDSAEEEVDEEDEEEDEERI